MFRALFELIVMFIFAMAARAILASVTKSFQNAARTGFRTDSQGSPPSQPPGERSKPQEKVAGELHKDPVCGMYVAESTEYQRRQGRETVYYCSEICKDKDTIATRA
jgi:hypothetical protein